MRYSIGAKFLAVVLCAAALLGVLTSTGGIMLLMGTGLYSKTPEAYREERIREIGEAQARDMAQRYCSEYLGSVQEDMAEQYLGYHYYGGFDRRYTCIELQNAQGEILSQNGTEAVKSSPAAQVYTIPVTGEYMHMLKMEAVEEPTLVPDGMEIAPPRTEEYAYYTEIGNVPGEVYRVSLDMADASYSYVGATEPVGILYSWEDGTYLYKHFSEVTDPEQPEGLIFTVEFQDENGDSLFFAHSRGGVGELICEGTGRFRIVLYSYETVAAAREEPRLRMMPEAEQDTLDTRTQISAQAEAAADGEVPQVLQSPTIGGKPLSEYQIMTMQYSDGSKVYNAEYIWVPIEGMTAVVYAEPGAVVYDGFLQLSSVIYPYREQLFYVLGISALIFAVFVVYLCCTAGHKPKAEGIHPKALNCLPLDVYLAAVALGLAGLAYLLAEGGDFLLRQSVRAGMLYIVSGSYAGCLGLVGFGFAFAAQVKTPGGYWWRNSLCVRLLVLAKRLLVWTVQTGRKLLTGAVQLVGKVLGTVFPALGKLVRGVWKWAGILVKTTWQTLVRLVQGTARWLRRKLHRILCLLPLTWQWLLLGGIMVGLILLGAVTNSEGLLVLSLIGAALLILYGAKCFGILMESTRRMSKGDLSVKVGSEKMVGSFKCFAGDLNDLADVAVVAAQKQLKSERMKTELITNVSHDIKTPLTSIINYVDLLRKPHSAEDQTEYLEVLSRQSLRLKKLIDDLMEMSKASTGNMTVELQSLDAQEFINQALGEFSDKLDRAQLIPVFRCAEPEVRMRADGRLVWRVLSNLLGNAVKYAMPGTRLYIDLSTLEGRVIISLKNISREELNLEAEELMERFVRGDGSRNTEGSGLGLNIAKSLMELQKGELQLLVDGDLFKVTLLFPQATD